MFDTVMEFTCPTAVAPRCQREGVSVPGVDGDRLESRGVASYRSDGFICRGRSRTALCSGPGTDQRLTMSFCPGRIVLSLGRILLSLRNCSTEMPFWTATR